MRILNASRLSLRDHEVAKQSPTLNGKIATSPSTRRLAQGPRNDGERGFTLAEILVVMAIVAIVGTILVAIFTATLRGSTKAQMLSVIKQNGQAVLENMDKLIRGADKVCVSVDGNTLIIEKDKDSSFTRFRFIPPSGSANGKIVQDNASDLKCSDANYGVTTTLTDTNTQTGVSVKNGSFLISPLVGYKDSVTVQFVLGPGVAAPAAVAGQIDDVTFQTTVQLRN